MAKPQATSVPTTAEKIAVLREFVTGFTAKDGYSLQRGVTLSPQRKGAITRKFNEVQAFRAKMHAEAGVRVIHTKVRSAASVAKVRELGPGAAVGYPKGFKPGLVYVQAPGEVTQVSVTKTGRAQVVGAKGVRMVFEPIDPAFMAKHPERVEALMRKAHPNANGFAIRAGQYGWTKRDVNLASHPDMISAMIARTLYRYGADVKGEEKFTRWRADKDFGKDRDLTPKNPDSNFYKNWVTGMVVFYFPPATKETFSEFAIYVAETTDKRNKAKADVARAADRNRKRSKREKLKGRKG